MSYPSGLVTKQVSFGQAVAMESGAPIAMRVTIDASRTLIHRPSGSPLVSVPTIFTSDTEGDRILNLPVTDSPDMGLGNGAPIILLEGQVTHTYTALIEYINPVTGAAIPGTPPRTVGPFVVPSDAAEPMDLDDLFSGLPPENGLPYEGLTRAELDAFLAEVQALIDQAQASIPTDGTDGIDGTDGTDGEDGTDGRGIATFVRTDGDGSAGTIDTYTVTYTDGTTSTLQVRNGIDGDIGTVTWDQVEEKPTTFPPSVHDHLAQALLAEQERNLALRTFHVALANADTQPANVLVVGASIDEGLGASAYEKRWISVFRDAIRAEAQPAGVPGGWNYFGLGQSNAIGSDVPVSITGGNFVANDRGLGLRTIGLLGGGEITATFEGTAADIVYGIDPAFTSFTYTVDGGPAETVNCNGPIAFGQRTLIRGLTPGIHQVVVTATADLVAIEGFYFYNGDEDSGIRVIEGGHSGYGASNFAFTQWDESLTEWNFPALSIINLNLNDLGAGRSKAEFKADLIRVIDKIKNKATALSKPIPSFVLMGAFDNAFDNNGITYAQYLEAFEEISAADPKVCWTDQRAIFNPGTQTTRDGLVDPDGLHPTDAGYLLIGTAMAELVLPPGKGRMLALKSDTGPISEDRLPTRLQQENMDSAYLNMNEQVPEFLIPQRLRAEGGPFVIDCDLALDAGWWHTNDTTLNVPVEDQYMTGFTHKYLGAPLCRQFLFDANSAATYTRRQTGVGAFTPWERIDTAAYDARYLPRSEHTGTQPASTIGDFVEVVQETIGVAIVPGANMTRTYDGETGLTTLSVVAPGEWTNTDPEVVRDTIAGAMAAGTNINIAVNDAGDTITISVIGLGTAATRNVPAVGDAAADQVVLGNDTRLGAGLDPAKYRGPWNPAAAYAKGDQVQFDSKVYEANQAIGAGAGAVGPTYVGSWVADPNVGGDYAVDVPAGALQVGDLLLLAVTTGTSATLPSGWGIITTASSGTNNSVRHLLYRYATASDVSSGITMANMDVTAFFSGMIRAYRNVDFTPAEFLRPGVGDNVAAAPNPLGKIGRAVYQVNFAGFYAANPVTLTSGWAGLINVARSQEDPFSGGMIYAGDLATTVPASGGGVDAMWSALTGLAVSSSHSNEALIVNLYQAIDTTKFTYSEGLTAIYVKPSPVLARVEYNPSTMMQISATATNADIDAANLTISFIPTTSQAIIELEGVPNGNAMWSLRQGSTNIPGTTRKMFSTNFGRVRTSIRLAGLTPGTPVTYKWAHRYDSSAATLLVGGPPGSEFTGGSGAYYGPAIMEARPA